MHRWPWIFWGLSVLIAGAGLCGAYIEVALDAPPRNNVDGWGIVFSGIFPIFGAAVLGSVLLLLGCGSALGFLFGIPRGQRMNPLAAFTLSMMTLVWLWTLYPRLFFH